jgi:hypothetical protein
MPYITQGDRQRLTENGGWPEPRTPGELNYVITQLLLEFDTGVINYNAYALIVGVLETCKLELYRRLIAPYEDYKIQVNGDVYNEPPQV